MRVLITAGNTQAPIDRVRAITNIFTGRTGAQLALAAYDRCHTVQLATSHPETVAAIHDQPLDPSRWKVHAYRTFDELESLLARLVPEPQLDVIVHAAAVSDYVAAGIYSPAAGTSFREDDNRWAGDPATLVSRAAAKVKSDERELWLRLVRAPKLIDRMRLPWGFRGLIIKFKLEVGVDDNRLLEIAEASRTQSRADLMVANTLEGAADWAYVGPIGGRYERLARTDLPARLWHEIESLHERQPHG